jgi:hypothetical protein
MSIFDDCPSRMSFKLRIAATYMAAVIVVGTFLFSYVEKMPLGTSFYFTVQTLFSIGYGDVPPLTDVGKVLTTVFIVLGICGFLAAVSIIGSWIIETYVSNRKRIEKIMAEANEKRIESIYAWAERNEVDPGIVDCAIRKIRDRDEEELST